MRPGIHQPFRSYGQNQSMTRRAIHLLVAVGFVVVTTVALWPSTHTAQTPSTRGLEGVNYAVPCASNGLVADEGSYRAVLAWANDSGQCYIIERLPHGFKRCNPAKRVCVAP